MLKYFKKLRKRAILYFSSHVEFNALVHMLGGIGLGVIIAYPMVGSHPVRWGIAFLILSLVGHFYAGTRKK